MLFVLLAACAPEPTDTGDTAEPAPEAPTLAWISPADGADVSPSVNASIAATGFSFVDLSKHSEGGAAGFVRVRVDGADVGDYDLTTFTLTGLAEGSRVLGAQLYYEDGDPVAALDGVLCDDDAQGCEGVVAEITVNVVAAGG